jgi:hypothetical protein
MRKMMKEVKSMGKQKDTLFKYPLIFQILGCIDLKASLNGSWL